MKTRKVPERMCAGCKERRPKKELIRVVRDPQGAISLDATGKKSGRGAYLCLNADCLRTAVKKKQLARSLSCEIPQEVLQALEEELSVIEHG